MNLRCCVGGLLVNFSVEHSASYMFMNFSFKLPRFSGIFRVVTLQHRGD